MMFLIAPSLLQGSKGMIGNQYKSGEDAVMARTVGNSFALYPEWLRTVSICSPSLL
jgi:hypothetical protein